MSTRSYSIRKDVAANSNIKVNITERWYQQCNHGWYKKVLNHATNYEHNAQDVDISNVITIN